MARREPFAMRSKQIEINIVSSRFGPLVTFLDVLLLMVGVIDKETVAFVKITQDGRSVEVDR